MAIVRAKNEIPRIESFLGDRGDLTFHVIPCAAQPQHRAHALPRAGNGVGLGRALVVVRRPPGDIGMKRDAAVVAGIMPTDGLARRLRRGDLGQHLRITADDAGKVHHFAKADYARPRHRLGDVCGRDFVAGRLQPRCRGRAGRHLGKNVDRLQQRLVMHQPDAAQAQDVGDLVWIGEHGRRAVRDHGGGELGRSQHARLDVHVPVAKPWDQEPPLGPDHICLRADAMRRVRADIGETPFGDRHLPPVQDLAGLDIDQLAAPDHAVGRLTPCRHGDKNGRHVLPGFERYLHCRN